MLRSLVGSEMCIRDRLISKQYTNSKLKYLNDASRMQLNMGKLPHLRVEMRTKSMLDEIKFGPYVDLSQTISQSLEA